MSTNDRNYYRMLDTEELIDLARKVQTNELALVLAERLKAERERRWNPWRENYE